MGGQEDRRIQPPDIRLQELHLEGPQCSIPGREGSLPPLCVLRVSLG
jgi:hypothetical protein